MYFIKIIYHYLLPQRFLTWLSGLLANSRFWLLKNTLIWICLKLYDVKLGEAKESRPYKYPSFNDFFIRQLKSNVRPMVSDPGSIACPADGAISQMGKIDGNRLIQAKGKHYTLESLLAHHHDHVQSFKNGSFSTIYLAPNDYHRVHMPIAGVLKEMIYVPGKLFSVCPTTARGVNNLFARNERVIAIFDTEVGPMAVILVGAMIVGSITTAWAGKVTPPRSGKVVRTVYDYPVTLGKGDELGYFTMGSTVITLFPDRAMRFNEKLAVGNKVLMGSLLGLIS